MDDSFENAPPAGPLQKPESTSDVGVRKRILEDLVLKVLYLSGPLSILELSKRIRLSFGVADELVQQLRSEQLCEAIGISRNILNIAITSQGRLRALELLSLSQYAGAAPVSLESYTKQVRQQSVRNVEVHPPDVDRAFAHLVLDSNTLRQLGTALNSGASIFLYGPTGTGKTSVAGTLARVVAEDLVWIPYAVEVDGQIIAIYDPLIHRIASEPAPQNSDQRWVRCHRPAVLVGGELTIEMLDLQFNPSTRFYTSPVQMKANDGVLIIDDFGRQRLQPEALLNRWVVPLDRGIDFLTLAGGRTVEIPFEVLVVFASNMDPSELLDAAYLRRIQTKIKMDAVSGDQFREIFRRVAGEHGLECNAELLNDLVGVIVQELGQPLRPCYPRDIVNQIRWSARYEGRKPHLDHASLTHAVEAYFLPKS